MVILRRSSRGKAVTMPLPPNETFLLGRLSHDNHRHSRDPKCKRASRSRGSVLGLAWRDDLFNPFQMPDFKSSSP